VAILVAALAIYALLLIILNRKKVSVDFVFFSAQTRVLWLVVLSIALGALIMWLIPRMRRRRRRSARRTTAQSRAGGVSWKAILIGALAIYAVLLIIFNSKRVSVHLVFTAERTRVIWLVLLSVALGALIAWLVPRIQRRRKRRTEAEAATR